MKNNSIIETENAIVVIAFGSQLSKWIQKIQNENFSFFNETNNTSDINTNTVEDICRNIIEECGYKINGTFLCYQFGNYYMAEDADQWWYIGDIGNGLDVIGYEVRCNNEYITDFDYRQYLIA